MSKHRASQDRQTGQVVAILGRCRVCQEITEVDRRSWYRASAPRCSACGGMLDGYGVRRKKPM